MRSGRRQGNPELAGGREQPLAPLALALDRLREALADRPERISISDEISSPTAASARRSSR